MGARLKPYHNMKRIIITRKLNTTIDDNGSLVTEDFELPKIGSTINENYKLMELSYSVSDNVVYIIQLCEEKPAPKPPVDRSKIQLYKTFKLKT